MYGASTGGAGRSGTSSLTIVSTARPSMKNLMAGSYSESMSMWDMILSSNSSLISAVL